MLADDQKKFKTCVDAVTTQWFGNNFVAFESDGTILVTEHQLEELQEMIGKIFISVKFNAEWEQE